ncbi:MAG: CAP domain-containing protein [Rubrivivax sp.]|nr:CAP domain-containing protein [Rubrivivax sp.]
MKHFCAPDRCVPPCLPALLAGLVFLAATVTPSAQAETLAGGLAEPAEVLALLNAQRAAGATCGVDRLPPAPPLRWHAAMEDAANDHLQDVADRPALTHVGSDGSSVGGRVWRHGYVWGGVGENVAGGYSSAADTLGLWLRSPSHCRTLMGVGYRDVAVVGRHFPGTRLGHYWVMVVARPLR